MQAQNARTGQRRTVHDLQGQSRDRSPSGLCATAFRPGRTPVRCSVPRGREGPSGGGYLTESDALRHAEAFAAEHSTDTPRFAPLVPGGARRFPSRLRRTRRACEDRRCTTTGRSATAWPSVRGVASRTWAERPLDTFTDSDLIAVRRELVAAKRAADTLNHYRRVVRGVFGTHPLVRLSRGSGSP